MKWLLISAFAFTSISALAEKPFTYEEIVALIKKKQIRSVEQLLPELPEDFRKNFVLIKNSESLQKSDELHPRVALFTKDAKLSCTFNGDRRLEGFDSFECYQFRDETRSFDFREILFPSKSNHNKGVLFSESNMRANKSISCTACHGKDPRPNWEMYSFWPGVYGGRDDSFFHNYGSQIDGEILKEKAEFINFKKKVKHSARYSALIFRSNDLLAPFSEKDKVADFAVRPNAVFTSAVSDLTAKRNARILSQLPKKTQYEFLQFALECERDPQYPVIFNEEKLHFYNKLMPVTAWAPGFCRVNRSANCSKDYEITATDYQYIDGSGYLEDHVAYYLANDLAKTDSDFRLLTRKASDENLKQFKNQDLIMVGPRIELTAESRLRSCKMIKRKLKKNTGESEKGESVGDSYVPK